jgi:hypothetical protein
MRERFRRLSYLSAMPCVHRLVFWSVILALSCADAHAGDGRALRGLKSVYLVVEQLDAQSRDCGIDDEIIKNSVTYPLANSRLKVSSREIGTRLYVNVTTFYEEEISRCTSNIELEVNALQSVLIRDTANEAVVKIVLWDSGALILGERDQHRERLRSALEERANQLVADWTAAQR